MAARRRAACEGRRARCWQRRWKLGVDRGRHGGRGVLFDKNLDRLRWVDQINKGRIVTLASNRGALERTSPTPIWSSARCWSRRPGPVVVTEDMVAHDEAGRGHRRCRHRPGRLHRDDHETTHTDPVTSCTVCCTTPRQHAGRVPHTSTYALTNATLPTNSSSRSSGRPRPRPATPRWPSA